MFVAFNFCMKFVAVSLQHRLFECDPTFIHLQLVASMCVLRARALEAHENRTQAVQWYCLALRLDSYCYEALDRLVSQHMLTASEEKALLADGLSFRKCDKWLEQIYSVKMQKVKVKIPSVVRLHILLAHFLFFYFFSPPACLLTYFVVRSMITPKVWRRSSSS